MKIAICDDNAQELIRISSLIDNYRLEKNILLTYKTFQSAAELVSTLESGGTDYDVLLLDILMPGLSGLQAAYEIREFDGVTKIIFLTSSPEFAVESYQVKAYNYILKPVSKEKLYTVLDELVKEDQKPQEGLTIKAKGSISHILFSRIVFVEVMNKTLFFHLSDGSVREVNSTLSAIEAKLLSRPEFIKVHRSYLVNLWHTSEVGPNGIITSTGKSVPISRLHYGEVRAAYMKHLFEEKGVR